MHVFLVGAGGFIGSSLARVLLGDGHRITAFGRDLVHGRRVVPGADWIRGDLRSMTRPQDWAEHLGAVDLVINAGGALQTGLRDDVVRVQHDAIVALASAAQAAGARHFIQISAAGADDGATTDFMASKASADAAVERSGLSCTILRPGLVIGRHAFGGTELLRMAAGLPGIAPDIRGTAPIQCVALGDVAEAVRRIVAEPARFRGRFDLVAQDRHSLAEIIALHRGWLGFAAPRWRLPLSARAIKPLSLIADMLGWLGWRSPLRSNAIAALVAGVHGDAAQGKALLGRSPLSLPETLAALGPAGKADRWHARLALLFPVGLVVLAAAWIGSGGLGLARSDEAAALLTAGGMAPASARLAVVGGSLADIAIGLGIALRPALRPALKAGIALALAYLAGSLWVRADLWLDPLAPMLKVLPMLALMLTCLAMANER